MAISRDDIERVALLARLEPSESQIESLTTHLAEIVEYVDQLGEVDTDAVEPMAHAVELTNVLRPDEPTESLSREEALASAPRENGVGFCVPAVLGD